MKVGLFWGWLLFFWIGGGVRCVIWIGGLCLARLGRGLRKGWPLIGVQLDARISKIRGGFWSLGFVLSWFHPNCLEQVDSNL